MSLNAPAAPAAPVNHLARVRPQQGSAHGNSSNGTQKAGGASFAQLLQGAVDDETDAGHPTVSEAKPEHEPTEAGEHPAEQEHRAEAHKSTRDPAEDATPASPNNTTPELPKTPAELAASIRNASLLAAARAKLGVEGRVHHAGGLTDKGQAGLEDKGATDARGAAFGAQLAAATETKPGIDISGMQPTLDNIPVNLANASTEAVAVEAAASGADFSLPSLGETPAAAVPTPQAPPPAQATLTPPPGSAAFPAALGAQLSTWMKDGVQYATLELNPQDMGPIDVRIALRDGRTQVELGADVAATRAALTQALPELAEALGDVGLSLSGGSVSDQTGQHARQGDPEGQRAFTLPGWMAPAREDRSTEAQAKTPRPAARGLIDLVA